MEISSKSVGQLNVADLIEYPVWEYTNTEEVDELQVRPVTKLPVDTLSNRIVGIRVHFHNGSEGWAILSNVSLRDARRTSHFLCLSVERHGQWFHLARYFDADYEGRGPAQLSTFLGLGINEVFPITYDLTAVAVGLDEVVRGSIPIEAPEKLTDDELIKMSLETGDSL